MPTRTYRLHGKAWATTNDVPVTAVIKYNGVQVFSGNLTTINGAPDHTIDFADLGTLCEWTTEVVEGALPLEIVVNRGTLLFSTIRMNQKYPLQDITFKADAVWAGYVPSSVDEVMNDMRIFTSTQNNWAPITPSTTTMSDKYGLTWAQVAANLNETVVKTPEENFVLPMDSTGDTINDRVLDAKLDGTLMPMVPANPDQGNGFWYYMIPPGSTFTATFNTVGPLWPGPG